MIVAFRSGSTACAEGVTDHAELMAQAVHGWLGPSIDELGHGRPTVAKLSRQSSRQSIVSRASVVRHQDGRGLVASSADSANYMPKKMPRAERRWAFGLPEEEPPRRRRPGISDKSSLTSYRREEERAQGDRYAALP